MINAKRIGNLGAQIDSGQHQILSGVAPKFGGNDEGPDPHELLQASLAACTIITLQMYANRKQWPLDSANVTIRIDSETKEGTQINRTITLIGNLTTEQKAQLLQIANKCPIHKLLASPIKISTHLQA